MATDTNAGDSCFEFPDADEPMEVFLPTSIASYCYLFEALLWMAFQRFPLAVAAEDGGDIRWSNDYEDAEPCLEVEPANDEECQRAGLPCSPEYAAFISEDYFSAPERLEELLAMKSAVPETGRTSRETLERDLLASREHYAKCDQWDWQFEQMLDLHKGRLFVALREGKMLSAGKPLPAKADDDFPGDMESEEFWKWSDAGWKTIPAACWLSQGINWERSWLRGTTGSYACILVPTKTLLDLFSVESEPAVAAYGVGDGYVIRREKGPSQAGKRGRPAFNWDELHLELAKRVAGNGLPKKQEALIADMQAWCLTRWRRPVGRSTLLAKISPYYSAFVRKSETRRR